MTEDIKILITYNAPVALYSVYSGKESVSKPDDLSESSFFNELAFIKESLLKYFSEVEILAVDSDIFLLIDKLNIIKPDVIVNFVESVEGVTSFESYVTGLYELMNIPYTGNDTLTLSNCLDKSRAKEFLTAQGINTPKYFIYKPSAKNPLKDFDLNFPVISKLAKEDASIGISENSVSYNETELLKQLGFLAKTYNQNIILEEYIDGREFNVAILDDFPLPISEICFNSLPDSLPKIVTYEGKWIVDTVYYDNTVPQCPANIDDDLKFLLETTAIRAYHALNCRDYVRVDIRLSQSGIAYVIEVNPNPDISLDSGFNRAAKAVGIDHGMLLNKLVTLALKRRIYDTAIKAI